MLDRRGLFLKRACWLLCITLFCGLPSVAQADLSTQAGPSQADSSPLQRGLNILNASTLESPGSEPFVLRVEYQLFDLAGNPGVKGKAEEFWTKNDGELVSIVSSSEDIGGGPLVDAYNAADRESYLVRQAMNAIVRPFPADGAADIKHLSLTGPDVAYAKNGIIYHLSNQDHIVMMIDHLSVAERSNFRHYDNHEVPSDIKLSYEGKPALVMHVTGLDSYSDFIDSKDYATGMPNPIAMRPQVHDAVPLTQNRARYPFSAGYQRLGGGVRIVAVVTMEGKVADVDVIASAEKSLAKAASDAVRKWVFQPYLVKGGPAEFETTVDIDFYPGR
jgi:TonB family protein